MASCKGQKEMKVTIDYFSSVYVCRYECVHEEFYNTVLKSEEMFYYILKYS